MTVSAWKITCSDGTEMHVCNRGSPSESEARKIANSRIKKRGLGSKIKDVEYAPIKFD